jgi:hypothetical protein
MTELAVVEAEPTGGSSLAVWADSARRAASVAVSLAKTPFVPQSLRGQTPEITAANITAAILTGQEVGLEPMAALRSIDVIQGTPAMRAVALRALVQSAGHRVTLEEATDTRAIVSGCRRGEDREQRSVWTMDRAKALGLSGKDNWRKQPQAMLVARATAELCRLVAADVILGVPYAVEELEDGNGEPTAATEAKQTRRTARRATVAPFDGPEPVVEPPAAIEAPAVEEAAPAAEPDVDGSLWPEPAVPGGE